MLLGSPCHAAYQRESYSQDSRKARLGNVERKEDLQTVLNEHLVGKSMSDECGKLFPHPIIVC